MEPDLPVFRPFTREELEIIESKIFDKKLQAKKKAEKRAKNVAVSFGAFQRLIYAQCDQTLKLKVAQIYSKVDPKRIHSSVYF